MRKLWGKLTNCCHVTDMSQTQSLSQGLPTPCFWSILDVPKMSKVFHSNSYMVFPKIEVPQNGWVFNGKPLLKWMFWGENPTIFGNTHIILIHFHSNIICCSICHRVEAGSRGSAADPKKASDLPFGDAQHLFRVHG